MLSYTVVGDGRDGRGVQVALKLLRGEEAAIATGLHHFYAFHMEHVWVNQERFPNYISSALAETRKIPTRDHGSDVLDLQHYSIERLKQGLQNGWSADVLVSNAISRLGGRREKKRIKNRKIVGKPAYATVEHAISEKRLFHSVVQNPLNHDGFLEGHDSDDDNETCTRWRLQIMEDEIEEYIDTVPVEKLFMNLWNQFITLEYPVKADHHIAPACMAFVKKHGGTITKLQLRPTLLRHLTELDRRGLLDSDAVFETVMALGGSNGEGRFLFVERIEKQEARRIRMEKEKAKVVEQSADQLRAACCSTGRP